MIRFCDATKDKDCFVRLETLYERTFPESERAPLRLLKMKANGRGSDLFGIYDGDVFFGMLELVYHRDIVFIWYFAVDERLRGHRLGSAVLHELTRMFHGKRTMLFVEEGESDEQKARRRFYLHNLYTESDVLTEDRGTVFRIMYYGGDVSYAEYNALMQAYWNKLEYKLFYREKLISDGSR